MGRLAQKGLLSPCGHRTRRWLAFPGRVAHTGQGSFRLVPCAPRPHRRSMRVTISIYFSLFKSHVPFCSVFQLAISNRLVEEKAGRLCAVCLNAAWRRYALLARRNVRQYRLQPYAHLFFEYGHLPLPYRVCLGNAGGHGCHFRFPVPYSGFGSLSASRPGWLTLTIC